MYCPFCYAADTRVIDSRLISEGLQVKRRRQCLICEERFTTFEMVELLMPAIIKRDGRREAFDENKLRAGMRSALQKRPVSIDAIEASIVNIMQEIKRGGEREIEGRLVGELVMKALFKLDHVAYVRFASVYRDFKDIGDFRRTLDEIKNDEQS